MLEKIKVVGYARFSSFNQRDESITAQNRFIAMYADNHNMEVVNWYADEAKTGKTMDRPEFQRLLNDAKNNPEFKAIIVHKFDRFSRNTEDTLHYKNLFKDYGIEVISVSENVDDTPAGRMMLTMMSSVNQYYIDNLSLEVMKGLKETALKGMWTGGPAPLGYDLVDGRLVINEEEAKTIRLIFEMAANGYGYGQIIDKLNALGYKTKRGGSFKKNSLHDLLENERYKGTYVFNRRSAPNSLNKRNNHKFKDPSEIIRIENGNPAIVSESLWQRANAIRRATRYTRLDSNTPYLLSGLLFCNCGGKFHGCTNRFRQKGVYYSVYRCSNRVNAHSCDVKEIRCSILNAWVIDQFIHFFFNDANIPIITEGLNAQLKKRAENNAQYKEAQNNLKNLERSRDTLIEVLVETGKNESIVARIKDFEQKIANAKNFLQTFEQQATAKTVTEEDVKNKLIQLREYMENPENFARTKTFLFQYIERIDISNETVKATFKVALPSSVFTHEESIQRNTMMKEYASEDSHRISENLCSPACATSLVTSL